MALSVRKSICSFRVRGLTISHSRQFFSAQREFWLTSALALLAWRQCNFSSSYSSTPAPVDAFFFLVPVADPVAPAPVCAAFGPLPVVSLTYFVPLAALFVSVPVAAPIPAVLVSAAQVPLAVSCSSHFPF